MCLSGGLIDLSARLEKPFSHSATNKPALLVPLCSRTLAQARAHTSPAFHSNVSRMTCGEGEESVSVRTGARVCVCAYVHIAECDTFCPINDGNQQAITAPAAAAAVQGSRWPHSQSWNCLKFYHKKREWAGFFFFHGVTHPIYL